MCPDKLSDFEARSLAQIISKPASSTSSRAGKGNASAGCRHRPRVNSKWSSSLFSGVRSGGGRRENLGLKLSNTASLLSWHAGQNQSRWSM
eukprot:5423047-Pyramimonas_sp.AAC.1